MNEPMKSPARPGGKNDGEQELSGPNQSGPNQSGPNQARPNESGPNLAVMYSLIALALVVAIGLAALIVWPFYQHRH